MPKKKKSELKDPHEGRPSDLTFGDFLFATSITSKNSADECPEPLLSAETETKLQSDNGSDVGNTLDNVQVCFVCRTKKGGIPVKVESRASGKKVTIIEHVLGDAKDLLKELKSKFGTGGIIIHDNIELQGDCKTKVMKFFGDNKNLLKPYGAKLQ